MWKIFKVTNTREMQLNNRHFIEFKINNFNIEIA